VNAQTQNEAKPLKKLIRTDKSFRLVRVDSWDLIQISHGLTNWDLVSMHNN
jgi:hypothetical protein